MKAEFDIGNLVYVILTIAFLAIGALGKKKKPVRQVSEEPSDDNVTPNSIESQIQELFRELNPSVELEQKQEYSFTPQGSVEEGPILDIIPEDNTESKIDVIPAFERPIDSNINYNDQAHSSLDTTGMEEGIPDFDYEKDHSSLIYNDLTQEFSTVSTQDEVELAGIVDGFDPKTAFVYSEIFNRKEF